MRLIGLTGTHGSGKTTLVEAFRGKAVIVNTSVSNIYKECGLNPQLPMSLDARLGIQELILNRLLGEWTVPFANDSYGADSPGVILTDRTPFDLIGYLLCEISGYGELTEEQNQRVRMYVEACSKISVMFDAIIHVPIGLPIVKRDKVVAADSIGYRIHLDMVMKGAMSAHPDTYSLYGTDHNGRVQQVQSVIDKVLQYPI